MALSNPGGWIACRNWLAAGRWTTGFRLIICVGVCSLVWAVVPGCQRPAETTRGDSAGSDTVSSIFCGNAPLRMWTEELLAECRPDIEIWSPETEYPRLWNPNDGELEQLQQATLIVTVGADYEGWLVYVTVPEDKVFESSRALYRDYITVQGGVHKHGPEGEAHSHEGIANYFWLEPQLAEQLIRQLTERLSSEYPANADSIQQARDRILGRLKPAESKLDKLSAQDRRVLTTDARFAYLLRRLGWKETCLHWTDHDREELPEDAWQALDKLLVESTPTPDNAVDGQSSSPSVTEVWFPLEPSLETQQKLKDRNLPWRVVAGLDSSGQVGDGKWSAAYIAMLESILPAIQQ